MPPDAARLDAEELTTLEREAGQRLAEMTRLRWHWQLETVARFWLRHAHVAKSTMHGFPLIAGEHVLGPPGAGEIADGVPDPGGRFALAVQSRITPGPEAGSKQVITDRHVVDLDEEAVSGMKRAGVAAARIMEALCTQQAQSIERGYGVLVPFDLIHRLPRDAREALEEVGEHA